MERTRRASRAEELRRRAAALEAEADLIERMPEEPGTRSVVRWRMAFSRGGRVYDYAAIHAGDDLWYTTGPQSPKGYTWERLIGWIESTTPRTTVLEVFPHRVNSLVETITVKAGGVDFT